MFAQAELQDKHMYTDCATVRSLAGRGVRLKQSKKIRSADACELWLNAVGLCVSRVVMQDALQGVRWD